MNRFFKIIIFLLFLFSALSLSAADRPKDDWSDFDMDQKKFYGSEKEEKYPINAFLVTKEDWKDHYHLKVLWLFKYSSYPTYKSIRVLPFWYHLQSKIDNRERTVIPILFYYNRIDGPEEVTVTPFYYSNLWPNDVDRSLFYLFWWGNKSYNNSQNYNSYIASPLFLYFHRKRKYGEESTWINPLFVANYSESYYKNKRYTWWAPIIPLTFHHRDSYGGHRNIFWLLDYSWKTKDKKDSLKRFWLSPIVYWKKENNRGYTHVLPPVLFMHFSSSQGDDYTHLLPPLYINWKSYGREKDYLTGEYEKVWSESTVTIAGSVFKDYDEGAWKGEPFNTTYTFPIIPILYYNKHVLNGKHFNLLWLLDIKFDGENSLKRFWIVPLWMQRFGDKSGLHILPPLFVNSWNKKGDYYRHFLPPLYLSFSYSSQYYGATGRSEHLYSLFGGSYKYYNIHEGKKTLWDKKFWFPFVPLYYCSWNGGRSRGGTHQNLLWLLDWAKDSKGNLERFWFMPFVYYKPGPLNYKVFFPFYIKHNQSVDYAGLSYGLFHFHSWTTGEKILWIWPYFSFKEKRTVNNKPVEDYYTHLLPVYFSWKLRKSSGKIILPWSITYRSKKKYFYLNVLGLSRSASLSPQLSLGFGAKRDRWYLDGDISWLYEVFSMSTRVSVKKDFSDDTFSSPADLSKKDYILSKTAKPSLSKKKTFSRENSDYFWGWKLLFGLVSYEMADTKRHFRLLPLSWLTWDTANDDNLFVIPPLFLKYHSSEDNLSYLVVFPFYASQSYKKSYSKGYLLNLYWDEYDDETKLKEKTILWPFINWYSSPEKSGWRFFPLIHHREKIVSNGYTSTYATPLSFSYNRRDKKDGNILFESQINPFYYKRYRSDANKENYSYNLFVPFIPLFYYHKSNYKMHWNFAGIIDRTKTKDYSRFFAFPLFFKYHSAKKQLNYLYVLPFYVSYNHKKTYIRGYLLNLYWSEYDDDTKLKETTIFWPLINWYSSPDKSGWRFLPFVFHKEMKVSNGYASSYITPLNYSYTRRDKKGGKLLSSTQVNPFYIKTFYQEVYTNRKRRSFNLFIPFIPIFYYHKSNHKMHWNFAGIIDREKAKDYSRFFIFPLHYYSNINGTSHNNILGIVDWKINSDNDLSRLWLLPLFMWYNKNDRKGLFLPLLLTHISFSKDTTSNFILGVHWYNSPAYSRQNILYLYTHDYDKRNGSESYSLLFNSMSYKSTPEYNRSSLLYGLLFKYKNHKNSTDYNTSILFNLISAGKNGTTYHNKVIPFWYYKSRPDDWYVVSPVTLSYFSKSKEGDFDLGLLGLIYYRNNKIYEKTDRRMWLLGILWDEVKHPSRGYHSRGMLWGLLWNYQEETETNFTKFTILKGLYKRVEKDGVVKQKFLWVF